VVPKVWIKTQRKVDKRQKWVAQRRSKAYCFDQVRLKVELEQVFQAVSLICADAFLWLHIQSLIILKIVSATFIAPPGYAPALEIGLSGKRHCHVIANASSLIVI